MEEGNLVKWHVGKGDSVEAGDVIAEIETDKATMEVEAIEEGTVGKILIEEGTESVSVNTPIAVLLEEGEDESALEGHDAQAAASAQTKNETEPQLQDGDNASTEPVAPATPVDQPKGEAVDDRDIRHMKGEVIPPPPFDESRYTRNVENQPIRDAIRDGIAEELRRDDHVFIMGEEVAEYEGAYKVTQGILDEFGSGRVIDTPITEHGFAGLAVGAAFRGLKPIVEFMTWNFGMQAMDQLINSAAKTLYMAGGQLGCPIVFRGPNGAASRVAAQHSQDFAHFYGHIPGLKVVAPYSAADAKGLFKSAVRDPNPVMVLENEMMYGSSFDVPQDPDFTVPIGRARIEREGNDVTLVGYSIMVQKALQAADTLAEQGIEAEVINLRTIRPIDRYTIIESVKKTNRIVSCEESWPTYGIGGEIAAMCMEHAFDYLDAPVARIHSADVPLPYAANLEKLALPQPGQIVEKAKQVCYVA
jgi:pyruvate dehydrogenase E1 component beta subunit